MPSDYDGLRQENRLRYGTDIGRVGRMLLANRYADRTHFIFELLQNTEDALRRRSGWSGSREIAFELSQERLRVRHYGEPFTPDDVTDICGIAESSKRVTDIGRFGIGFKSVYAFTDRPEIHSGDEGFVIENYVWPRSAEAVEREDNETVIILPLADGGAEEIERGLKRLGSRTLMFLREIDEIAWAVEGGSAGRYMRIESAHLGDGVRKIVLLSEEEDDDTEEEWLIFSREVSRSELAVGHVEAAFKMDPGADGDRKDIVPVADSPLVVFFPTVLQTHLGFLLQGPYRTTPSRDNVPPTNPWNQYLITETATLLTEALRWLRDNGLLTAATLRCLPLERLRFLEGSMFRPLFLAIRNAFRSEPLLPDIQGSHVAAPDARLARTSDLRKLFGSKELSELFAPRTRVNWLSSQITQDRAPGVRHYLIHELKIAELTPTRLLSKLNKVFLEARPDSWIRQLYEFLNDQPAVVRQMKLRNPPLIRLETGEHVVAKKNGEAHIFLPGGLETEFPTVRRAVCETREARAFLTSLGLTEPDPVDDIIQNVLPRFTAGQITSSNYSSTMDRILAAFETDSTAQRDKLVSALKQTSFVMAVSSGAGSAALSLPGDVYRATDRLKRLFSGVRGVKLVDDAYDCLRGDKVRRLLRACGAVGYLKPMPVGSLSPKDEFSLSRMELAALRQKTGHGATSWYSDKVTNRTLWGLSELLEMLPTLNDSLRRDRAKLLWEELGHLEDRRGKDLFDGVYTWTHNGRYRAPFRAAFVKMLQSSRWVPDETGGLQRPDLVLFSTLKWKANAFLESKIRFKPPIVDELAREAGIEPGVIDLLKELDLRNVAELRERLGVPDPPDQPEEEPRPPLNGPGSRSGDTSHSTKDTATKSRRGGPHDLGAGRGGNTQASPGESGGRSKTTRPSDSKKSGPFISYVAVQGDGERQDPDGLRARERMELETSAITLIREREPALKEAKAGNPGYDLFEPGADGEPVRWIEVKAMTQGLVDRPVGLSRTQFACARKHGEAYWIYVVEHAGDRQRARIVRIPNPAGNARTFTFDHGWEAIALDTSSDVT